MIIYNRKKSVKPVGFLLVLNEPQLSRAPGVCGHLLAISESRNDLLAVKIDLNIGFVSIALLLQSGPCMVHIRAACLVRRSGWNAPAFYRVSLGVRPQSGTWDTYVAQQAGRVRQQDSSSLDTACSSELPALK
jgi:hypothetical protein